MERVLSAIEDGKEGKISKALAEFNDKVTFTEVFVQQNHAHFGSI